MLRIVLVDDHPVVRDGLRSLLETVEDMAVVGEAESGEEALGVVAAAAPDVVIMDIDMPGMGGIEATRRLVSADGRCAVLVLTMYGEDEFVFAALRAGARGYLVKGARQEDVLRTIRAVTRGDAVFGRDVADRLLRSFGDTTRPPAFPELSNRERDVLALLADGLSNAVIGSRLGVSPKTVANYVSAILMKLHAVDRAEAVVRARRGGLGTR